MSEEKFLPISDAMARDLDNGRAGNRTYEDFIPDSALQAMKDDQDRRSVVRGEDLIPISKAEAARRTTFDGESLPTGIPSTRRVIPAPFKRDRVVGGRHGKTWHEGMAAKEIRARDIIPDIGLVRRVEHYVRHEEVSHPHIHDGDGTVEGCPGCFPPAVGVDVQVIGGDGRYHVLDAEASVRVFR